MATPTKNTAKVTVSKNIHVPASQLYSALTTRDHLNNWFCDNCFLQVQEGGRYVFIWNAENYSASGMFTEIVPDEKVLLTWRSTHEGEESELQETFAVTLVANGDDATTATIEHSNIAEEGVDAYQYQWEMRLGHLKTYAETGALPRIVNRVILGIMPQPVSAERAEDIGIEAGTQAQVGQVIAGLGAEKAGIEAGDVITHIDGQAISIANNLMQPVRDKTPGDVVDVTVVRDDETLSLEMSLSPYPVPEMPTDYTALAEQIAPQYDALMTDLHALIDPVSDDITSQRPTDGEWSVQMVLAHLLYSEDYLQDQIGGRISNGQPQHWSGNDDTRLQAIIDSYSSTANLLSALRREYDETLAIWRNMPDTHATVTSNLWLDSFSMPGWIQHTKIHTQQIKDAIEAVS